MATTRGYGGKEFQVRLGIRDQSSTGIGAVPGADAHTLTPVVYRLNGLNDIAWDAGYQRTELNRTSTRMKRGEDIINHYGSGVWTWDFDWTVDNEVGIQNLLNLIYPENANGADHTSGFVIPHSPLTTTDLKHGAVGAVNATADIVIQSPDDDQDRLMHGAILQNLTLSMDAATEGGALKASGQFMTGYKPGLADYDAIVTNSESTDSTFLKGLFDFTSAHTVGGDDASVSAFSLTISNPANRIGFQGNNGETDGYVRNGMIDVTGSITIKADDNAMEHLALWNANTLVGIELDDGSNWDFSLPACNMSGHNLDMADEGVMLEIPFTVTSGSNLGAVPVTIKCT